MKVCFTSHRYAPLIGGYDNQIRLLAEHLSRHCSVTVVTYNLTGSPQTQNINSVKVERVKPQLVFFRVPLSAGYLKRIGQQDFDLLHAHGFVPLVSDLSVLYAKSRCKATVYTHHFDGNVQDAASWNNLAGIYNKTVARKSLSYADAVVATTQSYAETSPTLKPCLSKVQVIPCFVDTDRFRPQSPAKVEALRRKLGLEGKKVVLFVGRIVPYKGVEYLIDSIGHAKAEDVDLHLVLVGGGEGKNITDKSQYHTRIQLQAQRSPAAGNIHFLGRVDNSGLAALYCLADVLALPSTMRGEAFGAVLLEALACGTPVVASAIPGVRDVLKGDGKVGKYVPPKDSRSLTSALIDMANQKTAVTKRCREFAVENYSVEKIVESYLRLYRSLGLKVQ